MKTRPIKIAAVAPWFGSARSLQRRPAEELGVLEWCGVPFAGGMPELQFIQTRGGVANDLHRHVINLARAIRNQPEAHPMIEYLYPRSEWKWSESTTSNQQGNEVREVLISRGPFKGS